MPSLYVSGNGGDTYAMPEAGHPLTAGSIA
jgi:hypothetical protein